MKHYSLLLMSLLLHSLAWAQPVNDNPTGAIQLPISASAATCPNVIYTNAAATATADAFVGSGSTSPSCYQQPALGFNFTVTRDVWFKFTAPASGATDYDISLKKTAGSAMPQLAIAVYRGELPPGGNLDQIACEMAGSPSVSEIVATVTNPIIQNGGTYYIRVDGLGGVGNTGGEFTLCIRPANPIYYMGRSFSSSLPSGTLYDSGGPLISPAQPGNYGATDNHVFRLNRAGAGCMEIVVDSMNINTIGVLRLIDEITGDTIDNIRGNASDMTAMRFQVASSQLKIEFKAEGVLGTGFKLSWLALPNCTFPPPTSCGAPQRVTLPYKGVNQTTCTDELRGVVSSPCGVANTWQGRDRIISFTSTGAQCIKVSVEGYNLGGMGVGLFKGCPAMGSGASCVATGVANGMGDTVYIQNARLELPGTYYLVLSRLNGCTPYNINIDTISCLNVLPGAGSCATALSLNDCSNTVPADVRLGLAVGVPPTPNVTFPNLPMGCFQGYNAPPGSYKMVYFKFRAGANGKFAFRVKPNVAPIDKDIDFNVWGPIDTEAEICNHIANTAPVRSSWSPATPLTNIHGTGLADTLYPPNGGAPIVITDIADCIPPGGNNNDGIVKALDVIAGKYYMVFLNDYTGTLNAQEGVNLNFSGTSNNVLAPFNDPATVLSVMPRDTVACPGTTMQFKATGGVRYTWSPATHLDTAMIATPLATFNVSDTTYSYQVQIQGTCRQAARNVNVQIFGLRKPNDETVCIGQRLQWRIGQIYNQAGVNYVWSASTGAAGMAQLDITHPNEVKFNALLPGVHIYTVQLVTPACTLSQSFTITVTAGLAPSYKLIKDTAICVGTRVTIGPTNVTPGTAFSWTAQSDPFTAIIANPTVNPATTLRYYVLMTNVSCPSGSRDSVDVTVYHLPTTVLPATPLSLCEQDSIRLGTTPTQPNATFRWTPSIGLANGKDTLASPMVVAQNGSQRYTLTATTGGGLCSVTKTVDVIGRNYKVGLPDTILFCVSNDTLRIKADPHVPNNLKLAWSWRRIGSPTVSRDTQLSLLHQPRFATQYTATLDTNGCRRTDTTMVVVDSLPYHTAITRDTMKPSYCQGEIIILKTVPAYDPIFFPRLASAWSPARNQLTDSTLFQMVIVTDTPSLWYYRTIKNGGCMRKDSVRVEVNPVPDMKITGLNPICMGETIRLTASLNKPIPPVDMYEWRGQGTNDPTVGATFTYTPTAPGSYTYQLKGKVTSGCHGLLDYTMVVKPLPALAKPAIPAVCPDESIRLNNAAMPGATYSWTGSGGFTSTEAQPSVTPSVDNATYVVAMDLAGCKQTDSVKITVARATLNVSPEVTICQSNSTTLTATGTTTVAPSSYSWTPSGSLTGANTATPVATPSDNTTYSVIYRYGPNCTLPAKTVKVNVIPNFTLRITPPQDSFSFKLMDEGSPIDLSSTVTGSAPGATYSWTENGKEIGTTGNITAKLNAPNNEFVKGQDASGYKLVESSVKSGVMTYKLTVKSTNGCSAAKEVAIRLRHPRFAYPNAFTPNSDTTNSGFRLIFSGVEALNPMEQNPRLHKGNIQVVSMTVYSRVGSKVYEETNVATLNAANYAGWNGNLNNEASKELPSDAYVYIIKVLLPDGTTKMVSDEIVLVR